MEASSCIARLQENPPRGLQAMSSKSDSGLPEEQSDDDESFFGSSTIDSDSRDSVDTHVIEDAPPGTNAAPEPSRLKPSQITREKRLHKLRKAYSDRYRELFSETIRDFDNGDDGVPSVSFRRDQIGAVTWQPEEKARFYKALSRKGRLDTPRIAAAVGSKSELEVGDYLLFLRDRERERHLFEKNTKRISHADIPAAVELGDECVSKLEEAADALAALQDQYDRVVTDQNQQGFSLIDREVAAALDLQTFEDEELSLEQETGGGSPECPSEGLFHLSAWIDLSERVFMNPSGPRLKDNWQYMASKGERPAMTYAAFSEFYDIAVGLTRRLMQATIFLAKSRLRSTQYNGSPAPVVRAGDVMATLDVLGTRFGWSEYWVRVPRRNDLTIVHSSRKKGRTLSYESVETDLIRRGRRNRRVRSKSANCSSGNSATASDSDQVEVTSEKSLDGDAASLPTSPERSPSFPSTAGEEFAGGVPDTEAEKEDSQSEEYGGLSFHTRQERRHFYLEHQQDAYMENLDRRLGQEEESQLWQILGYESPTTVEKETAEVLGTRPKVLRKSKDDLQDWQGTFISEWEAFGEPIPEQTFRGQCQKRRSDTDIRAEDGEARSAKRRFLRVREVRHSHSGDNSDETG